MVERRGIEAERNCESIEKRGGKHAIFFHLITRLITQSPTHNSTIKVINT